MILYHGTSERQLKKIAKSGLFSEDSFVYLTNNFAMAKLFASQVGGRPVVLAIDVKDTSRLAPDLNMYDTPTESLTKKYRVGLDDALWGVVDGPKNDSDWRTSLKEVQSIIYDGTIPPEDILRVWRL